METRNLIRPAADIVRVTTLRVNDVYKRLAPSSYHDTDVLWFGVVTDVAFDGTNGYIAVTEFRSDISITQPTESRVFGLDRDVAVLPAEPHEFYDALVRARNGLQRDLDTARRTVEQKAANLNLLDAAVSHLDQLTAPATTALDPETAEGEITPSAPEPPPFA